MGLSTIFPPLLYVSILQALELTVTMDIREDKKHAEEGEHDILFFSTITICLFPASLLWTPARGHGASFLLPPDLRLKYVYIARRFRRVHHTHTVHVTRNIDYIMMIREVI